MEFRGVNLFGRDSRERGRLRGKNAVKYDPGILLISQPISEKL